MPKELRAGERLEESRFWEKRVCLLVSIQVQSTNLLFAKTKDGQGPGTKHLHNFVGLPSR